METINTISSKSCSWKLISSPDAKNPCLNDCSRDGERREIRSASLLLYPWHFNIASQQFFDIAATVNPTAEITKLRLREVKKAPSVWGHTARTSGSWGVNLQSACLFQPTARQCRIEKGPGQAG
jgi:hypothetical protein